MWKLFYKLFSWDFVLVEFCHNWEVKKVTWFYKDAFCRPCSDRVLINKSEAMTQYGNYRWKPLTPNMFRYRIELQQKERKLNERT